MLRDSMSASSPHLEVSVKQLLLEDSMFDQNKRRTVHREFLVRPILLQLRGSNETIEGFSRNISFMGVINEHIATANLNGQISIYGTAVPTPLSVRQLEPLYRQKLAFLKRGEKLLFVQAAKAQMMVGSQGIQVGMIDRSDSETAPFTWAPDEPYGISDLSVCRERNQFAIALVNAKRPSLPGIVKLFSSDSFPPTEVATLDMPTADCRFISLSPDGKQVAVGGGDRKLYLIDTSTNTVLDTLEALNYDPPNPSAAAVLTNSLLLGKRYTQIEWGIDRVQYSSDGKFLAAGAYHGVVKIWDMTTKQLLFVLQSEDDHLSHVVFSPDNKRLVVQPANSAVVHQYDLQTGRKTAVHQGHSKIVSGIVFADDGDMLTSGHDGTIRRWGDSDQSNNRVLVGHTQTALGAAFHPNGKLLATGEGNIVNAFAPSKIRFWNLESRQCEHQLDVKCSVGTMRYDKSGDRLAVAGGDGVVRVFSDSMDSPTLLNGHSHSITSLDWNPKENELVSVSGSLFDAELPGEAIVWDAGQTQKRLMLIGHSASLSSVAYSPDGGTIITGSADKTVKIWESKTGKCIRTLSGPEDPVISLVYDPNGRWIAAGSGDIWNPLFPKPGAIHIWNTTTWELERVLLGHSQLVHGLSVTSDGSRLISCARNDKIRLWEPETGIELLTMSPSDYACGVCFSPNGKYLAVPNWSGKIDLFSANSAVDSSISSTERQ